MSEHHDWEDEIETFIEARDLFGDQVAEEAWSFATSLEELP